MRDMIWLGEVSVAWLDVRYLHGDETFTPLHASPGCRILLVERALPSLARHGTVVEAGPGRLDDAMSEDGPTACEEHSYRSDPNQMSLDIF